MSDLDLATVRDHLAAWYHTRRRRLPWRELPTPYRVWVSEVMLQQTQVATVIPYFERFVAALPTVQDLAAAPEEEVLGLWAGLGYYRRCRHLHAAARQVVAEHAGELPSTASELLSLPGVGRYTAGAIASIAFGRAEPLLDGNVIRVLSRLVALEQPVDVAAGRRTLWTLAGELLDSEDPSSHNQALMELGALVCAPRSPSCQLCPVQSCCAGQAAGAPERFPLKKGPRRRPKPALAVAGLVRDRAGRLLMTRRPPDVLLGGLWELPGGDLDVRAGRRAGLAEHLNTRLGLEGEVGPHLASVEHVFTHRHLTLEVYAVSAVGGASGADTMSWYTDARWLEEDGFAAIPLSRLTEKVLTALGYRDAS